MTGPDESEPREKEPVPPSNLRLRVRYDFHAIYDADRIPQVADELTSDMREFFGPDDENVVYMESARGHNPVGAIEASLGYEKFKQYRRAIAYNHCRNSNKREPTPTELDEALVELADHERGLKPSERYLTAIVRAHDTVLSDGYKVRTEHEKENGNVKVTPDTSTLDGFKRYMTQSNDLRNTRNTAILNHIYELAKSMPDENCNVYAILGIFHYGMLATIPEESRDRVSSSFATNALEKFKADLPVTAQLLTMLIEGKDIPEDVWEKAFAETQQT